MKRIVFLCVRVVYNVHAISTISIRSRRSEERHQEQHEDLPDQALQRDEDHAEHRRHDERDEDEKAVALEARVAVGHLRRQQLHQDVRAVERRQRDEVEDGEVDVVDDDELEDLEAFDQDGNRLGVTIGIEETNGAQDNLRIAMDNGRSFLVPYIDEFIEEVDLDHNRIVINMQEGLL